VIRLQTNFPWRRVGAALAILALAGAASGCVYRVTVQQGNFFEKRNTDQLTTGMTKVQVRYLLGTPMVPSLFDNDRWDYLFYLKVGRAPPIQRQLTVYFKDDKVDKIDHHGQDSGTVEAPQGRVQAPAL
jgi:outer membrane protein assembly factor BamE